MTDVVGVRFKRAGRVYYFNSADIELEVNDCVVVETTRGLELGWIVVVSSQIKASGITTPLKLVIRKAEAEDMEYATKLEERDKEALASCAELIAELRLPMKLLSAEYSFDSSRLTIFFSAEGRIDFRELVRQLSNRLKVRVELRQIGPRDETKLMGGFGRCGRPVCCATFLSELSPVSIKMAKEQNLPLNPMKISGICGRLLCCLGYECEQYRTIKAKMPRVGQRVSIAAGVGSVVGGNPLAETVLVKIDSGARVELLFSEVTILNEMAPSKRRRG
jgi:cell fate regulator YaaT (PSP1 superfamily)